MPYIKISDDVRMRPRCWTPSTTLRATFQQHSGTITVDSWVGEYTEFAIHLPRSQQAATAGVAG
jgi:hypothetical protein